MVENEKQRTESVRPFDPSIQTENIAFDPEDLIACEQCRRMNPPTRIDCLYCAGELDIEIGNVVSTRHVLRKLELWESGYNVILRDTAPGIDRRKIAWLLSMETENLDPILNAGTSLPLARVENEKEALILQMGLDQLGLRTSLVRDADLAAHRLPLRLSSIEFRENAVTITDFNTRRSTDIDAKDLALVVWGVITVDRVEALEKKRRRGDVKLIDETLTSSDESVIDIYSRHDPVGYRVTLAGFDFSCLGEQKALLAAENLQRLAFALTKQVPSAKLVDDYKRLRGPLGAIWEVESRRDAHGLQRSGFAKMDFCSIATTTNLNQFTKYSRLQWHLL